MVDKKAYMIKYRNDNKDKLIEYTKKYREINKEAIKERQKKWRINNAEYDSKRKKEWQLEHPNYSVEHSRDWYIKNENKAKERTKSWYIENKEYARVEKVKRGIATGSLRAHGFVKRAVKRGILINLKKELIVCNICKDRRATQYDHRDYNKPLEVTAVCGFCNKRLGAAIPRINQTNVQRTRRIK